MDKGEVTSLTLLDLSVAFDTIGHGGPKRLNEKIAPKPVIFMLDKKE